MLKSNVLYRRLWYVKRRNSRRVHILLRLAAIIILLSILISYSNKKLSPYLMEISEYRIKSLIGLTISDTVNTTFAAGVEYDDIVLLSRDKNGNVTSIETDITKLNKLSAQITAAIQEKINLLGKQSISIPCGALLGSPIFAASGPGIRIKMIPCGSVKAEFKSEFDSEGINQTRHRICLMVKAEVGVIAPLARDTIVISSDIPVAEAVIVGKVPQIYMDSNKGG